MNIDFKKMSPSQRYFAMVQTIIPRPIAWVLSDNGEQVDADIARYNLAPFSFFTAVCSDPPLLMFSSGKKPSGREAGRVKDTSKNIAERKHFVVHIASVDLVGPLNQSAETLDHGVSELERAGLSTEAFDGFSLPRIAGCPVAIGCNLHRIDEIGNTPQSVIYGEIERMFVDERAISPGQERLVLDPTVINPLSRLGGNEYSGLGDLIRVARPK